MLKDEIAATVRGMGMEQLASHLFSGFATEQAQQRAVLTSLYSGHHLLILGPPGSGKTTLANRIARILGQSEVRDGCPVNCSPEDASCPWCIEASASSQPLASRTITGAERVKRVQGSEGLTPEDLVGDLDPGLALTRGVHHIGAFVPGKLLRANRGILLIDFIDRVPERVLNTILQALEGDRLILGRYDQPIPLDLLVVATGSLKALQDLPLDLTDHFDVITLDYLADLCVEKTVVLNHLGASYTGVPFGKALDIVAMTRVHREVQRGVGTRGAIRYAELLSSMNSLRATDEPGALRAAARISLPHRLRPSIESDTIPRQRQIVEEILDEALGARDSSRLPAPLSKQDVLALVEEIAREDKFRKPLKYGALDLLLTRLKRFPESELARAHRQALQRLGGLYPTRHKSDNITDDLLADIEESRKEKERIARLEQELEVRALEDTISCLHQQDILTRSRSGWELGQRGLTILLDSLLPTFEGRSRLRGYGRHSTGAKSAAGEGRIVGTRAFRLGDRYRDISFRETIRMAIRNHRSEVDVDDIRVAVKDTRARTDIVLALDLSGTMRQLDKIWYAKASTVALALAAMVYGDRVGVVTFSNLAAITVGITDRIYRLTRQVMSLELHENAFTNIGHGLLKATQLFQRRPKGSASQHIVLISDGDATAPHPSPQRYALRQAAQAARAGITVSCICINEEAADPELMRKIARIGKGRIYMVEHEGLIGALLEERSLLNPS